MSTSISTGACPPHKTSKVYPRPAPQAAGGPPDFRRTMDYLGLPHPDAETGTGKCPNPWKFIANQKALAPALTKIFSPQGAYAIRSICGMSAGRGVLVLHQFEEH